MPGPSSRAMIWMPFLPPLFAWCTGAITISPCLAWSTMLRATSEIAAAISVTSAPLKPSSSASDRPRWRAVTMSTAELIAVRFSVSIDRNAFCLQVQVGKPFLQIEGGADALQGQPELNHGKSNVRLDADDHR